MTGTLNYDANGWPYFQDDGHLKDMPVYTRELATKLQNGDAAVADAENAATAAQAAAAAAVVSAATFGGVYMAGASPQNTVASDVVLFTLAIPAQTVATRCYVVFLGAAGFSVSAGQKAGLTVTAALSAAPFTAVAVSTVVTQRTQCVNSGQWYPLTWSGYLDIPANKAVTLSIKSNFRNSADAQAGNMYYEGSALALPTSKHN